MSSAGLITTNGSRSIGIFEQSLGGSGGIVGQGGLVKTDLSGRIKTTGQDSYGILAQSIGAGALFDPDATASREAVDLVFGSDLRDGYGGAVDVTLRMGGAIETHGSGAVGILAQAIGGGGGLIGGMSGVDATQRVSPTPALHSGSAGTLAVTLDAGSRIDTYGTRAHAIVAQTVVGGGFFAGANGDGFSVASTPCPANCGTSNISLSLNGIVLAHGAQSYAVFAQNYGTSSASTTISIGGNGVIHSDQAPTIYIDADGGANVINNGGYLDGGSAAGYVAIDGSATTINNGYFIHGDILAKSGQSHVINNSGTLWTYKTIQGTVNNNPGAASCSAPSPGRRPPPSPAISSTRATSSRRWMPTATSAGSRCSARPISRGASCSAARRPSAPIRASSTPMAGSP